MWNQYTFSCDCKFLAALSASFPGQFWRSGNDAIAIYIVMKLTSALLHGSFPQYPRFFLEMWFRGGKLLFWVEKMKTSKKMLLFGGGGGGFPP